MLLLLVLVAALTGAHAGNEPGAGQVQLPLESYRDLVSEATSTARPAPAGYALGRADVRVDVGGTDEPGSASVEVGLTVEVFESEWVLVPILPAGTPVRSVTVAGRPVHLVAGPDGLSWSTNRKGSHTLTIEYRIDPRRSGPGYVLAVPLPAAAATNLAARVPGTGIAASVVPSAGMSTSREGRATRIRATVPATRGVQISWNAPARRLYAVSRAEYDGELVGDGVVWQGDFVVDLFTDEPVVLPLLSRAVTLQGLTVDGEQAPILVEGERFATLLRGRGRHRVAIGFQVPVASGAGPPSMSLRVPEVPVSRFGLKLPGKKELEVRPAASIEQRVVDGATTATVHAPMTGLVTFVWSEAVPDDIRAETRSNAVVYHGAHAAEGVLYLRAIVDYEITRGETSTIELAAPPGVQINRIDSPSGAVADWRLASAGEGDRVVTVFLDRKVRGALRLEILYDASLPTGAGGEIELPLIRATRAHRQRGMVALLASHDRILNPLDPGSAAHVGENQLPDFVRERFDMSVAHTFKYADAPPRLVVESAEPLRVRGKFDAGIDTLISLGDATLRGSSSAIVEVKSGTLTELQLELPPNVNLLSLAAPALRTYRVIQEDADQRVDVEFTQELQGQFRIELTYERILLDGEQSTAVPTPTIRDAEVQQGRIAVEALTAVEVRATETRQLSALDVAELPRQLVLKTTNPILLAYKYVQIEPEPRLVLDVTRHRLLDVQEAAIDRADYRTLYTSDGLQVTIARFVMRNSRKQFLRIRLPAGSEVWSATVDGREEKPAIAADSGAGEGPEILIKVINQSSGFPVELVYATSGPPIERSGAIEGQLPRPDVLVTTSRWEVFLPDDVRYGDPTGNLELAGTVTGVSQEDVHSLLSASSDSAALRIVVPTSGIRFAFEKLYANQSDQRAGFRIPYRRARKRGVTTVSTQRP
jgi:hypothetical protein